MTAEEFEQRDDVLRPDARASSRAFRRRAARQGRARSRISAATVDAIATVDQLLARALARRRRALLARAQRERSSSGTTRRGIDIELAAKLLINADGAQARRASSPTAASSSTWRARSSSESRKRDRDDCETGFYLGVVLAEQRSLAPDRATCSIETAAASRRRSAASPTRSRTSGRPTDPPARQAASDRPARAAHRRRAAA